MKNQLIINLFLFTSSSKKLIFVFILLLILPFSGCKSVVKETVVDEPVRIVSPNGDVYVGEIVSGKPHGQGTITYAGNKYVGEWSGGRWDGRGTYTRSDGEKYVGEFKDGHNAELTAKRLPKMSELLNDAQAAGKLRIVSGVYHLDSGRFELNEV